MINYQLSFKLLIIILYYCYHIMWLKYNLWFLSIIAYLSTRKNEI